MTSMRIATAAAFVLLSGVASAQQAAPPPTGTQATPPPAGTQAVPVPDAAQAVPPAPTGPKTEILEQILVKVNGEIFTKTELEARQIATLRSRNQQMGDDELRKAITEVTPGLLVDAIDELLVLQRGKELGYKVTDEQFKRILENIRKENKLEDDAQFTAALKQEGLDLPGLRRNIERNMVGNQVRQVEVMSKISVVEDEARAYYDSHKNEFMTPAQLTLRELAVAVKTDGKTLNVSLDEAAKAKAEIALQRARKGESFEKLVAEFSDSDSKANGGIVGPLSETDLDPAIRKLIDPLKPGEVTDVFRTRGGWAILQIESATKAETKAFEVARPDISEKVAQGKMREEYQRYIQKLRAQAIIDWKNAEMKKLWEGQIAAAAPPVKGNQ
jgi:parvulin-like peptidyl-prolyl isomerase